MVQVLEVTSYGTAAGGKTDSRGTDGCFDLRVAMVSVV